MRKVVSMVSAGLIGCVTATPLASQTPTPDRAAADQRFQISAMERVFETAVEHGAAMFRNRLQALLSADLLLSEHARVRGYRLEGYGMFFDVSVPTLVDTLFWSFLTLDRNNLGLDSALNQFRAIVEKTGDPNLEQALKRIELQVATVTTRDVPTSSVGASSATPRSDRQSVRVVTGSAATDTPDARAASDDPILSDPEEAYRLEVRDALIDAMLDHSNGLRLAPEELLTVAASGSDDRSRLGPGDRESRTVTISVRGADLAAFLARQISREDARKRITVRVF